MSHLRLPAHGDAPPPRDESRGALIGIAMALLTNAAIAVSALRHGHALLVR